MTVDAKTDFAAITAKSFASKSELLEFCHRQHAFLNENIRAADNKAIATFAAVASFGAFLSDRNTQIIFTNDLITSYHDTSALAALFFLLISGIIIASVVIPRAVTDTGSVIFWGTISKFPNASDYVNALSKVEPDDFEYQHISQVYFLSLICRRKFGMVRFGMLFAAFGIFLGVLSIILEPSSA